MKPGWVVLISKYRGMVSMVMGFLKKGDTDLGLGKV